MANRAHDRSLGALKRNDGVRRLACGHDPGSVLLEGLYHDEISAEIADSSDTLQPSYAPFNEPRTFEGLPGELRNYVYRAFINILLSAMQALDGLDLLCELTYQLNTTLCGTSRGTRIEALYILHTEFWPHLLFKFTSVARLQLFIKKLESTQSEAKCRLTVKFLYSCALAAGRLLRAEGCAPPVKHDPPFWWP